MTTLGFDNYVEPLKVYLQKYRDVSGKKAASVVFTCALCGTVFFVDLLDFIPEFQSLLSEAYLKSSELCKCKH